MATATELDSGGGSKRRRTGEGGERAHPGAGAAEEDSFSSLPEALRLHILGLLPFKSAVRTGALSTGWRALWAHRWPAPSSLDLRLKTHAPPPPILESLERRGRRRLDRFSLTFQIGKGDLKPDGVHRVLDYAAACSVADLHVDFAHRTLGFIFKLRLPQGDPHLTRLTVGDIRVGLSKPFSARSHTFSVLEVICLEGVTLSDHTVENLVAACPLLRTLDLRYCDGLDFVNVETAGPEEPHRRGVQRGERHFYHGGAQPSLLPLQRLLHPRPNNPCHLRARRPLPMLRRTCWSPPASRHPSLFRVCLACRGAKKLASGTHQPLKPDRAHPLQQCPAESVCRGS
ncbi:hypothetical protein VPH35_090385 [Triticum aestivum]|uniref:putative F-box/LRR-repeat protein At5g02930 n=1 Tax=Triticum aestivum TaxID=4565 RepID=UPI001D0259D2|nr:putative F-box/LRR-repeat protein At5g02930 [Triticum aestivum]